MWHPKLSLLTASSHEDVSCERNKLRNKLKTICENEEIERINEKIIDVEKKLSNLISADNTKKFKDNFSVLCSVDGSFISTGF